MNRILISFAALMLFGATPVSAQGDLRAEIDTVRQSNDIVPLREVIQRIKRQRGGRYLDAELKRRSGGKAEYHIDWEKDGRKFVVIVDAKSGRIIRSTGG